MLQDKSNWKGPVDCYGILVWVCMLLILGLAFTPPVAAQTAKVEELKIGLICPLSGGAATLGIQMKLGAEIAVEEINKEGGIKALGGAKIKLIVADSKSTPEGGMAETERLIVREKVIMLQGAFQSAVTFPATEVSERYKTPWLINIAAKDEITVGRGFKYVFRDFKTMKMDVIEVTNALELFAKAAGTKPKTLGLLCESSDWGRATANGIRELFPKLGYKIVMDESYPPGQSDFSSQILKIKAAKPDMLHMATYTPDHILFSKQAMEQKLYLPYGIMSYGAGAEDPAFYKAVPVQAVEYMFVEEDMDLRVSETAPWYASMNNRVKAALGYDMNNSVLCSYGVMYLAKDVLERAPYSTNLAKYRDNIRDAAAATNITPKTCGRIERAVDGKTYCPAMVRGVEQIVFDKDGQNPHAFGSVSQNIKGKRTMLFYGWKNPPTGELVPGTKVVWPVPTWEERK